MANADGELTVAQRLGRALDRGLLPAGGPAEAAERLIERLERPARLALLGLPGSGKSSILNLLVGAIVVPETLRLPTIIVQHGDVSRMVCTLTDGTTKILPGSDLAEVLPLAPALVTLEMDLPALRVISLLEVSAGPMEAEQRRAATWASKRADIVIWCTTSYLPKEQAVWESLPDSVKDNSFMFLTKVDLLGGRDAAQAMHDRVELRAGEEFRQILSISAKQARAAMPPGGAVNRDLFRESGAGAVITAIKTRVQSGRRADMDTAELLLARHVEASELVAKRFADSEDGEPARAWTPPPEPELPAAAPAPAAEPQPEAASAEPAETEPEPAVAPEPEPEQPAVEPPLAEAVSDTEIEPEPEPTPAPEPAPEPEPEPGTRRRFADRIKRVASDADPSASPMVPLRSTWKSKAELAAQSAPEPEPPQRELSRRPRAAAQIVAEEPPVPVEPELTEAPVAAPDVPEPALSTPAKPEPALEDVVQEATPARRERPSRAATPRPEPSVEAARPARPQLFGARRGAGGEAAGSPLPDLSALRATPEEMEAALQAAEEEERDDPDVASSDDVAPHDFAPTAEPTEPEDLPPPTRPARTLDRPSLSPREPRVRPAAPIPEPEPRSPAPPRPSPRVSAAPAPAATASDGDPQFSPRSIMQRAQRAEPDTPAPRRERPRIAPRAVPAAAAPMTAAPASGVEHSLLDEAISLIATRSSELEHEIDPEAKVPVDLILEHARETGEQVQAVVSRGRSEELRRINSDLGEVMDLIMLMQLEKGHAPADDALTLILQLKRELETLRMV